jgi:hypothetical protein
MSCLSPRRNAAPFPAAAVACLAALLGGCAGNGEGLDANGQPIMPGNAAPPPLTADYQSIQDNVFTPICVRCHSGAAAPEGLQLDAAHAYDLLVGVPSSEQPQLLRVDPGAPDRSYLVLKLEGAPGILGAQMPFGETPLPQATIDVIRQWISDGAQRGSGTPAAAAQFTVTAVVPPAHPVSAAPMQRIVVAFSREVDASLVNYTTVRLDRLAAGSSAPASDSLSIELARGNPRTLLITPGTALAAGSYRLTLRGSGGGALADTDAVPLAHDYTFEFTVGGGR